MQRDKTQAEIERQRRIERERSQAVIFTGAEDEEETPKVAQTKASSAVSVGPHDEE